MNFQETLNYLDDLGNEVLAMKLGLDNITKLLAALGHPEKKYFKVQVAGTNGKGSTCAFLEAVALAAGIETGVTTSPHLVSVTERVRINGEPLAESDFARLASRVREASERLVADGALETVPTFFEQVTAVALAAFAEAGVRLAILETGLGGRFDATTAARAELVGVTRVDFDHEKILGPTLAAIAAEKAAIIRADTRAVIGPQPPEAYRVLLDRCREVGIEPVMVPRDFVLKRFAGGDEGLPLLAVDFATVNDAYHDLVLSLRGRHQAENALVAVALAESLRDFGFDIAKQDIWTGLENARHPGRLETVGGVLFDGAHNAGGARALRAFLDEFVAAPLVVVFGAVRDKDLGEIAGLLFPKADRLILTRPDNERALAPEELRAFVPAGFPPERVVCAGDAAEALRAARALAADGRRILVTGSLYLVGEMQKILKTGV